MAYKIYKDVLYPGWADFEGEAENCLFTFKTGPEQLDWLGQSWYVNKMISSARQSVEEHGGHILRMTVWRDISPTLETKYKVQISAYSNPVVLT